MKEKRKKNLGSSTSRHWTYSFRSAAAHYLLRLATVAAAVPAARLGRRASLPPRPLLAAPFFRRARFSPRPPCLATRRARCRRASLPPRLLLAAASTPRCCRARCSPQPSRLAAATAAAARRGHHYHRATPRYCRARCSTPRPLLARCSPRLLLTAATRPNPGQGRGRHRWDPCALATVACALHASCSMECQREAC